MSSNWKSRDNPWIVRGRVEVHRNAWFAVEDNDVVRPNGEATAYQIVRMKKRGAGVLALEADGRVHMIGQWRLPLNRYSWELPMGGAEEGETALQAAQRELSEESGIEAELWTSLFELDLSTSLTDERCSVFLATGLKHRAPHPEAREMIERRSAPFMEVIALVDAGIIREAATVAALLCAYRFAVSGKLAEDLAQAMLRSAG